MRKIYYFFHYTSQKPTTLTSKKKNVLEIICEFHTPTHSYHSFQPPFRSPLNTKAEFEKLAFTCATKFAFFATTNKQFRDQPTNVGREEDGWLAAWLIQ